LALSNDFSNLLGPKLLEMLSDLLLMVKWRQLILRFSYDQKIVFLNWIIFNFLRKFLKSKEAFGFGILQ